jgi:predicted branched-subunit amino acid permease
MSSTTAKSTYLKGFRDGLPFLLVLAPFGLLFGVVGTEAGLNIAEVMGFGVLVIAGAAQFTAVQLMVEDAPTLIVLATSLAVNLRMAMYSAAMVPHLGKARLWQRALVSYSMVDQTYALADQKFQDEPTWTLIQKLRYFAGTVTPICSTWYTMTYVGAKLGSSIPPEYALDFAIPITFLALIAPALRTLPHVMAAATSAVVAMMCMNMPYSLGIIIAGIAAMIAGAQAEFMLKKEPKS